MVWCDVGEGKPVLDLGLGEKPTWMSEMRQDAIPSEETWSSQLRARVVGLHFFPPLFFHSAFTPLLGSSGATHSVVDGFKSGLRSCH